MFMTMSVSLSMSSVGMFRLPGQADVWGMNARTYLYLVGLAGQNNATKFWICHCAFSSIVHCLPNDWAFSETHLFPSFYRWTGVITPNRISVSEGGAGHCLPYLQLHLMSIVVDKTGELVD